MWGDCLFLFCSGSRFSFLKHFLFSLFSFILCASCQDVLLGLLNSFQHRLLTCPLGHGHIQTLYFSTRSLFTSVVFITDGMNICVCEAAALHSFTATLTLIIRIFILPMNHVTAHMWKRFVVTMNTQVTITGLLPPRTIHVLPDCVYLVFPTLFLQSASSVVHNSILENLKCQSGSFKVSVLHFLSLRMDDSSNCLVNFFFWFKNMCLAVCLPRGRNCVELLNGSYGRTWCRSCSQRSPWMPKQDLCDTTAGFLKHIDGWAGHTLKQQLFF